MHVRPRIRSQSLVPSITVAAMLVLTPAPRAQAGDGESALRRNIAWQAALDRVLISPGVIDGKIGPKTALATREFQRVRGLPTTGQLDSATAAALKVDPESVLGRYTIRQADLDEIGPSPASWVAKSKLKRLGHESLTAVIGEKFHCTQGLLATLNGGRSIDRMKPGDKVAVPIVGDPEQIPAAKQVQVDLTEKIIRVVDDEKRLVGMFYCSVAAKKAKLPSGRAQVVAVAHDPTYRFDPKMWPEVKERVGQPLTIPPGPRNPVGRCWIALNLPGVGMHGTPNPELIGKTGSHGCIRLTNWDAIRLSKMVREGTPVVFEGHPDAVASTRR